MSAPPAPPSRPIASPPAPSATALCPTTRDAFRRILERVARERGIRPLRTVRCEEVDRGALLELVRKHVDADVPRAAIQAEGLVHKLLGDFPAGGDYEAETYALIEKSLSGYYEPANQTMYLARDLGAPEAESTLSHELVHALEDQRWDLRARSSYVDGEDDHDAAVSALAEGDASVVAELTTGQPLALREGEGLSFLAAIDEGEGAGATPRALRRSVLAPYVAGVRFVDVLRREGGWARVDDAWERPPETTEQVLHPEKWRNHEPAEVVPPPPAPAGLPLAHSTTYGELGVALALAAWMSAGEATVAASRWGGDRLAVFRKGDRAALSWHIRFDEASPSSPDAFAARAFASIAAAASRLGHILAPRPDEVCVDRGANGVLGLSRHGRDVFVSVGAVAMATVPWRAIMTCSDVVAWNEEATQRDSSRERSANRPSASYSTDGAVRTDR